ncbi:MAG: DUF1343 domain-containing protein [Candidatus Abyssubacteria bacterium]
MNKHLVKLGITRLLESELDILEGARVGVIANAASTDEQGTPTPSLLRNAGVELHCIFAPEHGFNAAASAGETVSDSIEPVTGLPVISLYGQTRQPTPAMLRDIDAIVFDLQDIGVRCYTYIWTMALAMQAAAVFGKLFIVLDRPNPIGGVAVQGPMLDTRFASFMGMYPIPLRHGMTAGELALLFNQCFEIGADLAVIRMQGWRRRLVFSDTGLAWRLPSPSISNPETALCYAGTCLFEGVNLSEGRGTSCPFRLLGAPWLDRHITTRLDKRWTAGFTLTPQRFVPQMSKHAGMECTGFAIAVVDKEVADPIALTVALLSLIAERHPELQWNEAHFDALAGSDSLRRSLCKGLPPHQIFEEWKQPLGKFEKLRQEYMLYEG